ncbi:ABC transporter permease [Vallitalea guaymasensis]|uniref:ABC transporter permease n=1 Tax=Vallitalea guaymasensis TaxID=1185412 RepID=UPI000DE549DC|nr:ABC transporter permease [Vallitalea guaymasensis]
MKNNVLEKDSMKKIDLQSLTLYIGAIAILIIFTVVCRLAGKNFLTFGNIQNVITQSSVIAVIAIGQSVVILTGGIDLSVGSTVGFVGIVGGLLIKSGMPIGVVCILLIAMGILVGACNGALISYGKIPAFIVTLGSLQIIRGVTMVVNSGKPISGFPEGLRAIMNTKILGMPISILYVFILYAIMMTIMTKTRLGRWIYSIGGNAKAAKLAGVKTKKIEVYAYVISGIFAAIGGILLLSRLSYADPNAGSGYELDSIAAVVIGGIAMSGGKGNLGNTLVGALILGMLKCGLQILNVPVYYQTIIIGLAIITAVFFDKAKERRAE